MTTASPGYFFDETSWRNNPKFNKDIALMAVLDPKARANLTSSPENYIVGMTSEIANTPGNQKDLKAYQYYDKGWNLSKTLIENWDPQTKSAKSLAQDILSNLYLYPANQIQPSEGQQASKKGFAFWCQDLEVDAKSAANGPDIQAQFAGILAAMWAGHQVLKGSNVKKIPIVSRSIMTNLHVDPATQKFDKTELVDLNDVIPMLQKLGINNIKDTPPPDSSRVTKGRTSWNLMSVLKHNGLIDGFIYEEYGQANPSLKTPLRITSDHAPFDLKQDLPYAIMGWYYATNNNNNLPTASSSKGVAFDYYDQNGVMPINAAAYFSTGSKDIAEALAIDPATYFFPTSSPLANATSSKLQYSESGGGRIIDLSMLPSSYQAIISIDVSREADYSSYSGFYRLADSDGSVTDPISGQIIAPGQFGYKEAALSASNRISNIDNLSLSSDGSGSFSASLHGGMMFAPFTEVTESGHENTFFSFAAANSDGFQHFKQIAPNSFGMEDMHNGGDKDFNDLIIDLSITEII